MAGQSPDHVRLLDGDEVETCITKPWKGRFYIELLRNLEIPSWVKWKRKVHEVKLSPNFQFPKDIRI